MLAIWSLVLLSFLNPEFLYVFSILKCTLLAGGNLSFSPIGDNTVQDSDFFLAHRHWPVFCTCSLSTQACSCHHPQEHILGASCRGGRGMILKFPSLWVFNGHLGDLEVRLSLQLMDGLSIGVQVRVSWNYIPLMPSDIPIYLFPHLPLPLPSLKFLDTLGAVGERWISIAAPWETRCSLTALTLPGRRGCWLPPVLSCVTLWGGMMLVKLTYFPTLMHSNIVFIYLFIFAPMESWKFSGNLDFCKSSLICACLHKSVYFRCSHSMAEQS